VTTPLISPAELAEFVADAESLMTDAGTAKRPTGGYTNVGGVDVEDTDDLFDSPCKVQTSGLAVREVEGGGRTSTVTRTELHLPVSTTPLTAGDLFEVTSVSAFSSVPVGRVFRVLGPVEKTWPTARRYDVEAIVS
jgi:hypothetical protein